MPPPVGSTDVRYYRLGEAGFTDQMREHLRADTADQSSPRDATKLALLDTQWRKRTVTVPAQSAPPTSVYALFGSRKASGGNYMGLGHIEVKAA